MNSVERVKFICKKRKIAISKLEKDLGFSNGYISQLRKGVFPADRLALIADYLSCSPEFLLYGVEKKPDTNRVELNPNYFNLTEENRALVDALIAQLSKSQSDS
jgi:transcriptional regulator with XRE-family HTH domain